jgi:hypothetical protein
MALRCRARARRARLGKGDVGWHIVQGKPAVRGRINSAPDRHRPQFQVCVWNWGR